MELGEKECYLCIHGHCWSHDLQPTKYLESSHTTELEIAYCNHVLSLFSILPYSLLYLFSLGSLLMLDSTTDKRDHSQLIDPSGLSTSMQNEVELLDQQEH